MNKMFGFEAGSAPMTWAGLETDAVRARNTSKTERYFIDDSWFVLVATKLQRKR
jgi:hypothetical protein